MSVGLESHQIGAIARGKPAEHLPQTEERPPDAPTANRSASGKGTPSRRTQIGDRACHVEHRPGERPIVPDAAAVACSDCVSVQF
jgi:hypothetical protein